jgi:hypothetical protein
LPVSRARPLPNAAVVDTAAVVAVASTAAVAGSVAVVGITVERRRAQVMEVAAHVPTVPRAGIAAEPRRGLMARTVQEDRAPTGTVPMAALATVHVPIIRLEAERHPEGIAPTRP